MKFKNTIISLFENYFINKQRKSQVNQLNCRAFFSKLWYNPNVRNNERKVYMKAFYNATDLAKYVVHKCNTDNKPITNLQLQKFLYYIQGYFMKRDQVPAFSEEIRNWPYGPVVPDVYFYYNIFGADSIEDPRNYSDIQAAVELIQSNRKNKKLIDQIIDSCQSFTVGRLVNKTHQEDPWKNTKTSETIHPNDIEEYFCNYNPLGISF